MTTTANNFRSLLASNELAKSLAVPTGLGQAGVTLPRSHMLYFQFSHPTGMWVRACTVNFYYLACVQIGNRFRCYPTPAQAKTLLQWIGCQRYVYNAKVGEDQYFRRFARKSLTQTGEYAPIDQQYSQFKSDLTPWLSEVPSLMQALADRPQQPESKPGAAKTKEARKA